MYVVAQRVISTGGSSGINAFLFLHGELEIQGMSWSDPDVEVIADSHPGKLVLQRVEQPTGGNDVTSYLDIVASDSTELARLGRILLEISAPPSYVFTWSVGQIGLRFASQSPEGYASEFEELRRRAVLLLLQPGQPEASGDPERSITILAQDVAGVGMVYRLDPESVIGLSRDGISAAASVRVAYEDMGELKNIWGEGEYHDQIVLALTGVSLELLRRYGGYAIRHVPSDPPGGKFARDIPGQIDGNWIGPTSEISKGDGWPSGALLLSPDRECALDLVFVESAWFPMSEAALYTYQHSAGLQGGERWRFAARDSNDVFEVSWGPSLTRQAVSDQYGREAFERSRMDHKTVQLLLKRLPRV